MEFSLVMAVYAKENPLHLSQCFQSIERQTIKPTEIILVKDGPLGVELEKVIKDSSLCMRFIAFDTNMTQGIARAEGTKAAKYKWVALMDSDDICMPDRFKKQLEFINNNPNIDMLGGQVMEFEQDKYLSIKNVPLTHKEIITYAKKRNPFNAMTMIFKRDIALQAGNFRYFPGFEDYDLWVRMINAGAICANHPDILVDARTGSGMYKRRKGLSYIKFEYKMQKQLKELGLIGIFQFIKNIILRIPIRLLPTCCIRFFYSKFARGMV